MRCAFSQERSSRKRQRRNRTQRQPRLHWPKSSASQRSPLIDLRAQLQVAHRDVAEQKIAVSGHRFCIRGNGKVRAERQRTLSQRRRRCVVDRDQRARTVRRLAQHRDVADLHARIAWRFQPQQPRPLQQLRLRVSCGGSHAQYNAHLGEVLLHQDAGGVIGV